jgi:uncharacterized integral membrane protein
MQSLWLKIKVWTKITIFAVVLLYALIFVIFNANQSVRIWFWFGKSVETTALGLMFGTLILGSVLTLLAGVVFRTIKQVKDLRRQSAHAQLQRDMADMKARAAVLNPGPGEPPAKSGTTGM